MVEESAPTTTMYATKRRRRSVKAVKTPMKDPPKSNPSKRHRLRLNAELDHLASLLPFEQSVISKLDRLSILRLGVSYLRTKTYFQAALHERYLNEGHHHIAHHLYAEPGFTDTDSVLNALNGFLFVVTCDGEVFFSSRTVEQYLGFHQSDIIHQSALELIHSEDREDFKSQLNWRSQLGQDQQDMTLQEVLLPENSKLLQRSFTVRFRCLLDNTSGFITLEINGHIKTIHGQSLKGEESPLALMAICCPFGPLPLLDVPPRDYTFKTKHKMDLAPISMDHRGKLLFGYSDHELQEKGGYDMIHPEDLSYYAAAHQELIKTGSSGLIAYRLMTKDFRWLWLQTSSKVIYKNSKPDFVICTHRHLTDDEGRDLVGKRGSEFKLPYPIIDTDTSGLGSPLDEEMGGKIKSPRGKKSKGQLRDYLTTGRKRKTPYREAYNGINGYNPYATLNGYPAACPTGDVKPDIMYPYTTGQNFSTLDSDLYRSGYPFTAGTMYPATAESFRLEAEKHGYATNGYYLEPRQYQHTLQYHGNGYSDYMAQTSKYSYDMTKYGYDVSKFDPVTGSYTGLDLTKRPYDEADLSKYDSELRRYGHEYSTDKLSRLNGSLDPLKTGALYGTTPILNNDNLITSNMSTGHSTTSPCSLYGRSDMSGAAAGVAMERYSQDTSLMSKDNNKNITRQSIDNLHDTDNKVPAIPNGHASVIRNASPRTKSPRSERSNGTSGAGVYGTDSSISVLTSCGNPTSWPSTGPCKTSPHESDPSVVTSSQSLSAMAAASAAASSMGSRIMSPASLPKQEPGMPYNPMTPHSNSPIAATSVTSVIQQSSRIRSCDKQSPITGGIAVPVVKSSSWLHHTLPTPAYDWSHLSGSTAAESYSCHQRALRSDPYSTATDGVHRGVIEAPKYLTVKDGDGRKDDSNPLLSFSEVTHTLLNGD